MGEQEAGGDVGARRAQLRARGRAARAAMGPAARTAASLSAVTHVAALGRVASAAGVLLTAAVGDELDLAPLRAALLDRGTPVALPRVEGDDLVAVAATADTTLRPGWRGVPEPVGDAIEVGEGWVVLVPGLVFDRRGGRLGYGGGHFDRFLAAHPAATPVGVAFACQLVDAVPLHDHDVVMAEVVTERGPTLVAREGDVRPVRG